ncbi:hypothetical protein SLEP1_g3591 [Rubroshorea leprosula]|uniref:K-box domain-containing protein n=1 Tax=Rubroshorea leprosula TaxID=152421 RepID=A0AAV5HSE4_9ROSI|nr:hypothetical protein SLEP1_g3591 [Rubroshorea leprosula]
MLLHSWHSYFRLRWWWVEATCKRPLNDNLSIQKKFQLTSLKWNNTCRKLLGQGLCSFSVEELQEIGSQLEQSLKNFRARKVCNL